MVLVIHGAVHAAFAGGDGDVCAASVAAKAADWRPERRV
jgi:hypothetical protein